MMETPVPLQLLPPAGDPTACLTPREREVLELVASGRSNRAICAQLCVATKTLERHIANIYDKLELGHDDTRTHRRVTASLMWLGSSLRDGRGAAPAAPAAHMVAL